MGDFTREYIGRIMRLIKGNTRRLDYSSYHVSRNCIHCDLVASENCMGQEYSEGKAVRKKTHLNVILFGNTIVLKTE